MATPTDPLRLAAQTFGADLDALLDAGLDPSVTVRPGGEETTAGRLPAALLGPEGPLEEGELLGEGGMGRVHAAHDRVLERTVAIKRPRAETSAASALVAEARTLARLDHPNVVPVHALGVDETGRPVVVMKRVHGRLWSDLCAEGPDVERDLEIALELCDALRYAHARGVYHRDLKPDNVMVGEFGEVYLMDWGCAASGENLVTTELCGTPGFLAPEMLVPGAAIGARTDVFLLGATLHRVFTGQPRHIGGSLREVLEAARRAEPARYDGSLPGELGAVLNRACAADPAERYPDVESFAAALRGLRAHREAALLADRMLAELPAFHAAIREAGGVGGAGGAGSGAGSPGEVEAGGAAAGGAAAGGAATGDAAARAEALYAELRVGFQTALRGWPGNQRAQAGLREAAEAWAAWKLERGELDAAEAAAGLCGDPEAVRARVGVARSERARRELALREHDLSVAARERLWAGLLLVGSAGVGMPVVVYSFGARDYTPGEVLVTGVLGFGAFLLAVAPFWGTIRRSPASRAIMGGLAVLLAGALLHRTQAWIAGTPAQESLRADAVWMGAGLSVISLFGERGLAFAALPYLVVSFVMLFWPTYAGLLYPLAALPSAIIGVMVFRRRVRSDLGVLVPGFDI